MNVTEAEIHFLFSPCISQLLNSFPTSEDCFEKKNKAIDESVYHNFHIKQKS